MCTKERRPYLKDDDEYWAARERVGNPLASTPAGGMPPDIVAAWGNDGQLYCAACWWLMSNEKAGAMGASIVRDAGSLPPDAVCASCGMPVPPTDPQILLRWRLAERLTDSANADIWYDANAYGDEDTAQAIEDTQQAMQTAARLLWESTLPPATGDPNTD